MEVALAFQCYSLPRPMSNPILLYDGVCGLCNRFVQFILHHDPDAIFRFASLQSPLAAKILSRHQATATGLDTVYLVLNPGLPDERLLSRSAAVLHVLKQLGPPWGSVAYVLQFIPQPLRDLGYNFIARRRYRIFGRSEICMLPRDSDRARFLDS